MVLKPQDVLVVLKLLSLAGRRLPYAELGRALGMSASEANAAFHRAKEAGLINPLDDRPMHIAVAELLIHELKYLLPVKTGGRTRGVSTGYAAPPLAGSFGERPDDPDTPVWPDPGGIVAGLEIRPIFPSVPDAGLSSALPRMAGASRCDAGCRSRA